LRLYYYKTLYSCCTFNSFDFYAFSHAEGYVKRNTNNTYLYVYQYKDHLGNIRLSYADVNGNGTIQPASEILEENNYYPFGLKHKGYNEVVNSNRSEAAEKYKFQEQERNEELGLDWDSFKWRNYDYAIGRFMNIDPLSDKYSYQSHYNFSENRVIDGRELEGLEVVLINPNRKLTAEQKASEQRVINGSKNLPHSNSLITVTAHGSPRGISNDVRGDRITTGKGLDALLNRNSDNWKNKESGEGMTVVLYSCRTGACDKNEDGSVRNKSIAQQISGSSEFKDVEIIAPDQRMYFTDLGPVGAYEAEAQNKNDEYKVDSKGERKNDQRSNVKGNWNVFKNGELIRSYEGDWVPTNTPSIWDQFIKEN